MGGKCNFDIEFGPSLLLLSVVEVTANSADIL